jgi:transcriptional regulator with XRE-family HTH domain
MMTLKEAREKAVLSQRELAEKTGLAHATVNRIEIGRQKPYPRTRRLLAEALGVKPADITY